MPSYIILGKYTTQGIQSIKQSPARVDAARKAIEAAGGKMGDFRLTLGQYDFVVEAEAPTEEAYATLMLAIASGGTIATETLRAFSEAEFRGIVDKLP
ncbi:MAG TPA: GYD domain-containing protein [Dehalococcoidia bacterium]|nr:GYD domain-containing protein [Dehalococcoidia bacterium]